MPHRILLAGVGPLPEANAERLYAPALRLWAMMHTLLRGGHHVLVAEARFGEKNQDGSLPTSPPSDALARPRAVRVDLRRLHAPIPLDPDRAAQALRELAAEFRPEALVTTTDVMSLAAVRSGLTVPIYCDFFGDPLAERQIQGAVHDSDAGLLDAWKHILPALLRADHFSACSKAQRFALLGQLGAAGRLNRHTCYHNLVDVLPQGLSYEQHIEPTGTLQLRKTVVPPEAIVVLFTGGYNTWLDERTLFVALEEAMSMNPAIHYVSTGGDIPGHNTVTFEQFKKLVENSRFKNRFHFLGWVPTYQLGDICDQAEIAINLDRWSEEAELGLRNRLYLWMVHNTAIVTTAVSEEVQMFAARKVVRPVACGDSHAVASAILELAKSPDAREMMTQRACDFLLHEYSFERLMRPLAEWADSPGLAPDRLASMGEATRRAAAQRPVTPAAPDSVPGSAAPPPPAKVENPLAETQARFLELESVLEKERQARMEAEKRLASLEGSRVVKFYKSIFKK